jgi:hypothetical protein
MLLTTITTQPQATIYIIQGACNLIATVAKWQPTAEDEITSFKVPVYDLGPIDQIDDESGALVAEYEYINDAIEMDDLYKQSTARDWAETMDVERV